MRVGLFTLGCDKNTVDNEYLAGLLEERGCEVLAEPGLEQPIEAAVVLTCGFIADAKEQSIDAILELARAKTIHGNPRTLFVAGCLAQKHAAALFEQIPEIDGIVGVGQMRRLVDMILDARMGRVNATAPKPFVEVRKSIPRKRLTSVPYAFLKIADGCNHACSFCSIPQMKGPLRSVAPDILLAEAAELLAGGVRELNLVAQDISVYGVDRWRRYRLPDLLNDLCALDGDFWVRCLYCYPGGVTDKLLRVMTEQPKIVPYLDIPFQHFDPGILERMGRPFGRVDAAELVARIRKGLSGIALRTTMLVGFPGESTRAHQRMIRSIRELRFDRLGAFIYSREEDTPAADAPHQVRPSTKQRRWEAVMAAQMEIAEELSCARIGRRLRVLLEGYDKETGRYVARSASEAPEVDGSVFVEANGPMPVGEFVEVVITAADVYDVLAKPTSDGRDKQETAV